MSPGRTILEKYCGVRAPHMRSGAVTLLTLNIDGCTGNLYINIEYKIYAPEIGINTFETFYNGLINIDNESSPIYFTNNDIQSGSLKNIAGNQNMETLITYVSQTGKYPNGKYLFHLRY